MKKINSILCYFLFLAPVVSFGLLFLWPSVPLAYFVAVGQLIIAFWVGRILVSEFVAFTHVQGLWLGLGAVLSITVGFGSLYSLLLLDAFPTKEHFRFSEDTFSSTVMNRKYSRMYFALTNTLVSDGLNNIEDCSQLFEEERTNEKCGEADDHTIPPTWEPGVEEKISEELAYVHLKYQEADLYNPGDIIYFNENGIPQQQKLDVTYREIADYWRATIAVGLNYPHGMGVQDAIALDIFTDSLYPEELDNRVMRALYCHYGSRSKETYTCELGESKLPAGARGKARLFFANQNLQYLYGMNQKTENREMIFNGLLFSALSLMTSGHSDMTPKSNVARVCLFFEFLAFVAFLLLILPIGLKPKPS